MAEKLEFDLIIKNNQLLSGLNDAIKKSDSLGGALSTALGVVGGGVALKALGLLGDGMKEVIGFAKDSVKAFSEQEDALNKVGQALRASGEFSNAAVADFNDFAGALQKTSIYGDEVVLTNIALAKSFGASNSEAKKLVQAAANLSATFGGDLDSNTEKLGKTLNGTLGRLAQFIPELKNLTKEQLEAGAAADLINEKFGGAAQSQLDTYSGSVTAMGNAFSDMQEEIGRVLAKNTLTIEGLKSLKGAFEAAGQAAKFVADSLGIGLSPIDEQRLKIKELGEEYNATKEAIKTAKIAMETNAKYGGDRSGEAETIKQINQAEQRLNEILRERQTLREALRKDQEAAEEAAKSGGAAGVEDEKIIESKKKLNDQLLNLDKQLELEREQFAEQRANANLESELVRNQEELQRTRDYELQKIELDFQLKEDEAKRIQDHEERKLTIQKIAKEKELALIKANQGIAKKEDDQRFRDKEKAKQNEINLEQQKQAAILGIIGSTSALATALTKDGSREQFLLQKAAALAQAIIATNMAAAWALAVPPAPNVGLQSMAYASGAINIAAIAATAIKGYATGGVLGTEIGGGASMGPDTKLFAGRDGEMVLNADQQKVVYDALNGGGFGNQPIIVQIDGREIARAVRNQKNSGFRI